MSPLSSAGTKNLADLTAVSLSFFKDRMSELCRVSKLRKVM